MQRRTNDGCLIAGMVKELEDRKETYIITLDDDVTVTFRDNGRYLRARHARNLCLTAGEYVVICGKHDDTKGIVYGWDIQRPGEKSVSLSENMIVSGKVVGCIQLNAGLYYVTLAGRSGRLEFVRSGIEVTVGKQMAFLCSFQIRPVCSKLNCKGSVCKNCADLKKKRYPIISEMMEL